MLQHFFTMNPFFAFALARSCGHRTARTLGLVSCGVLLALQAAAAGTGADANPPEYDYPCPAPGTYTLPVIQEAADGAVLEANGQARRLQDLTRGRVSVLSFIYTRCASARACPHATGVLRELHQASALDPALARGLRLISLSFDPSNDTPDRMALYATQAAKHPQAAPWHFLTTASRQDLAPILDQYGQVVERRANPRDPAGPLAHTLRVFLIDTAGRVRNVYSADTLDPRLVLADVKTLMLAATELRSSPVLTPAQAARRVGQTATVRFKVACTATVTDITNSRNSLPREVLLLDAPNHDDPASPHERATIVVAIPQSSVGAFDASSLDALARPYVGQTVTVTGRIDPDPAPFGERPAAAARTRVRITVTEPGQMRLANHSKND